MLDTERRTNPFPGLRSFEPDEDHLFFGRESRIDEMLTRLRRTRFLSVVGTSGSGKSSLIRSGLIPSLSQRRHGEGGLAWRIAIFRPGENPIGNLAEALNAPEVLGPEEDADMNRSFLEVTLRRSGIGLVDCVREAGSRRARTSSSSSTSSRSCSGSRTASSSATRATRRSPSSTSS